MVSSKGVVSSKGAVAYLHDVRTMTCRNLRLKIRCHCRKCGDFVLLAVEALRA